MILSCYSLNSFCLRLLAIWPLCIRTTVAGQAETSSLTATMKTTAERFWPRVNKNGSIPDHVPKLGKCWIWTGAKATKGYGFFLLGNIRRTNRASWFIHNGEIPKDIFVLHKCDNRLCVNLAHLFLGTANDNIMDCIQKGRHARVAAYGENQGLHKLTESDVIQIRKSKLSQYKLAKIYGVSQ